MESKQGNRTKTDTENRRTRLLLSFSELCEQLHISTATGRNWVRLGKLVPAEQSGKELFFTEDTLKVLLETTLVQDAKLLKSRRNKKMLEGSATYQGYIDGPNERGFISFLEEWKASGQGLSESEIKTILAGCAQGLLEQRFPGMRAAYEPLLSELCPALAEPAAIAPAFVPSFIPAFEPGQDFLGFAYGSMKACAQKKKLGCYFTPGNLAELLVNRSLPLPEAARVLDPGAGSGNLLIHLLMTGLQVEQLHGYDIDPVAVCLARINLILHSGCRKMPESELQASQKAGSGSGFGVPESEQLAQWIAAVRRNIRCTDFLTAETNETFDLLLGNPPWGGELPGSAADYQKYSCYKKEKGADICDLFLEQAMRRLNKNGVLCFLIPEAILHVKAHDTIRSYLTAHTHVLSVDYLGQEFPQIVCPVSVICAKNNAGAVSGAEQKPRCHVYTRQEHYSIEESRAYSPEGYTFWFSDQDYETLCRIESGNRCCLKNNAVFALGIVTGDNRRFVQEFAQPEERSATEPILTGRDIEAFRIHEPVHRIVFQPEQFQQCAAESYYRAEEKLVYRFIGTAPVVAYDNQKRLCLNSCNLLIPQLPGLSAKYIMAVLNSGVARFYFEKKFHTMKILRSQLEQLPIPVPGEVTQRSIIEKVDELLAGTAERERLCSDIDEIVYGLYGIL